MKTFMIEELAKAIAKLHNKSVAVIRDAIVSQSYTAAQLESQYEKLVS